MFKKFLALVVMLCATLAMAAVDVNKATDAQLDSVKGIGPGTSKLILAERKKGEFKDWQDFIDRVKGVGEARAAKLSAEGLTVNGSAYKAVAAKKDEKKDEKKDAKADKKSAKAETAKPAASATKAEAAKPAASAAKVAASGAKPAASAKK
jgi:competence protein ComEA